MSRKHPLTLGPIRADGWRIQRSGLRWLVAPGARCAAGEVVAYCTVGLEGRGGSRGGLFPEEHRDLFLGLAVSCSGTLSIRSAASLGGDLDQLQYYQTWDADEVVAEIVPDAPDAAPRLLLRGYAGRRMSGLAELRAGLLSGWHDRARAWHAEGAGWTSVLSLGICEQTGIFRGDRGEFGELLAAAPAPLHVVHMGDESLVPVSRTLVEQMERSDAENAEILKDMMRGVAEAGPAVQPDDLLFLGAAGRALTRRPLMERPALLSRAGVAKARVDAVVLSIHAEPGVLFRHRRLGYHAFWHSFRITAGGRATREWLQTAFEPVHRSREAVKADLARLAGAARAAGVRHVLVLNAMSSSGHEDLVSYAPFEGPLGSQLDSVSAKEANLMLHDLEREADIAIVDLDALAAAVGGGVHLPDGVHASRRLQQAVREEILEVLARRGALTTEAGAEAPAEAEAERDAAAA